jgi:hypothetical protein
MALGGWTTERMMQGGDHAGRCGEEHAVAALDRFEAEPDGEMSLADPESANGSKQGN